MAKPLKIVHVKDVDKPTTFCGLKRDKVPYGREFAHGWRYCLRCKPHAIGLWVQLDDANRYVSTGENPPITGTSANGTTFTVMRAFVSSSASV